MVGDSSDRRDTALAEWILTSREHHPFLERIFRTELTFRCSASRRSSHSPERACERVGLDGDGGADARTMQKKLDLTVRGPSERKVRWAERVLEAPETLTWSQYRTAYYLYIHHSPHWRDMRRKALAFYGRKCRGCGSTERLQIHHRWYTTPKTTALIQLTVLCKSCHEAHHKQKGKRTFS